MAQQLSDEWDGLERSITSVARTIQQRGLQFGLHYQSLNALAMLWAWRYLAERWARERALKEVPRDAWEKHLAGAFGPLADRWLVGSQWAGYWGYASLQRVADIASKLAQLRSETDGVADRGPAGAAFVNTLTGLVDPDMFGTYLAGHAATFLARPRPRPFFCYVSFHETHSPFNFPAGWPRRDPAEFAPPPVSPAEWDECPDVFRDLTAADRRGVIAAYHTSSHFLDRNVGRVLDALDQAGRAGDTLVLFTSDHGYFLGQRGRFEKHACFDPAVRAAVVARWLGVIPPGRASAALASLIDLAPTVLEACGLPVPPGTHGRSLLPLWRGEADAHRDRVYLEYADNAEAGVRTDRWKLVYCAGTRRRRDGYAAAGDPRAWVRLYDLAADPGEVTNLSGCREVAAVEGELLADLAAHVRRTDRRAVPADAPPRAVLDRFLGPPEEHSVAAWRR